MSRPKSLIIACGALARELKAVIAINRLNHLDLVCLPAIWHNTPDRIVPSVRARIRAARRKGYADILCLYGDCGTGGLLDAMLAQEGVSRIPGEHCYAFFVGASGFPALHEAEIGTFYLTDYLARHFDRLVIAGLGLDRHPHLRDAYFGHYTRVLHLAQTDDASLTARAERAAARLGLRYERRLTGYGDLPAFLSLSR